MNTDWDKAIAFVLNAEGGYTDDQNDPGGETNFGISKKAYPNIDIKNLTMEEAKGIYRRDYWQPCRCDELPSGLAICIFDCAVNQGVSKAKRILQIALNVNVDGVIGDDTITAAFKSDINVVKRFLAIRLGEYAKLMIANQALLAFAFNWFSRVISLSQIVLAGA